MAIKLKNQKDIFPIQNKYDQVSDIKVLYPYGSSLAGQRSTASATHIHHHYCGGTR